MNARDVACPECGAQPGEPCRSPSNRGRRPHPIRQTTATIRAGRTPDGVADFRAYQERRAVRAAAARRAAGQ